MKKIYYLGYYDIIENKNENRNIVLSATNKMSYIIEAIEENGYSVEVISTSQTKNKQGYEGKCVPIGKNSFLRLFKTLPWGNKLRRVISVMSMRWQYRRYILKTLKTGDTLIAYHSVPYAAFLAWAKRKIGFRLVLEVEEIYADVTGRGSDRKKEYKAFSAADAYIFPTKLLNDKLNTKDKPYVIIHGTYKVEPDRGVKFNDGKIHIVYAGTLDPRKGGAIAAAAGEFLNSRYHVHILGFGGEKDRAHLLKEIARVQTISDCTVTYDGLLSGEEYIRFLQGCDIGLSAQNPDAAFNDTSFPSKILSYMANGLRVVSIRIPAIETSAIGEYMYYYNEQTPEKIADAIKKIDFSVRYDSRKIILELDEFFIKALGAVF